MSAAFDALTSLSIGGIGVLNAASVAWLVVAVALMVLGEFESRAARRARWALAPVALVLAIAFAAKLVAVFGPMFGSGSA